MFGLIQCVLNCNCTETFSNSPFSIARILGQHAWKCTSAKPSRNRTRPATGSKSARKLSNSSKTALLDRLYVHTIFFIVIPNILTWMISTFPSHYVSPFLLCLLLTWITTSMCAQADCTYLWNVLNTDAITATWWNMLKVPQIYRREPRGDILLKLWDIHNVQAGYAMSSMVIRQQNRRWRREKSAHTLQQE